MQYVYGVVSPPLLHTVVDIMLFDSEPKQGLKLYAPEQIRVHALTKIILERNSSRFLFLFCFLKTNTHGTFVFNSKRQFLPSPLNDSTHRSGPRRSLMRSGISTWRASGRAMASYPPSCPAPLRTSSTWTMATTCACTWVHLWRRPRQDINPRLCSKNFWYCIVVSTYKNIIKIKVY